MRTKTILLGSVSAIAAAAAGAGHAQAANTTSTNGYTFSVQGGLALTPAELSLAGAQDYIDNRNENFLSDKFGSGFSTLDDLDQAFGYNAAVSIGKDLGNGWDVRVGATVSATGVSSGYASGYAYGWSGRNSGGTSSWYASGVTWAEATATEQFSFQALDFEVGYTPVLTDTLSVRLFGGVRAVHSLYSTTGTFGSGYSGHGSGYSAGGYGSGGASGWYSGFQRISGFNSQSAKTEFFGAGPRVGVDVSKRFEGTNFGISGRIAGAVLFGQETTTYSGYASLSGYQSGASGFYSGGNFTQTSSYNSGIGPYSQQGSSSFSVDKKIADVEAQIGFDYYLDDSTALTIGYQAEKFIDLDDSENGVDHLTHGAFLKLSGSF